jgi:hypothetical protein
MNIYLIEIDAGISCEGIQYDLTFLLNKKEVKYLQTCTVNCFNDLKTLYKQMNTDFEIESTYPEIINELINIINNFPAFNDKR